MALMEILKSFLILACLLILMCDYGNGAREIPKHIAKHIDQYENKILLVGESMEDDSHTTTRENKINGHDHSHASHMQSSLFGVFTLNDLYVGKKMPIDFPRDDPSLLPYILPREEADTIPFSLKQLPNILQFFSISPGTSTAKSIENTLRHCETEAAKGETKVCATSLESMLDFVRSVLGSETPLKAVSSTYQSSSTIFKQNYTVLEVEKDRALVPKMVACHLRPYPYAVFLCHTQEGENNVIKISLQGENGSLVHAVAVCHMDTAGWSSNHMAFSLLGIKHGAPMCHIFSPNNFVWLPITK